jgi:uroporphyrinogen-III decarboxylase
MSNMPFTDKLDAGKSCEQLFAERAKRFDDAMHLRQPDRIPVNMGAGYFLADYCGLTHRDLVDNPIKAQEALERVAFDFQPDGVFGIWNSAAAAEALGDRMVKYPGHGLPDNGSFQFDEKEFMKAEDYGAFLHDPSNWIIRTYLPRAFSELAGLGAMPPLGMFAFGHYNLGNLPFFAAPPVQQAMQTLNKAAGIQSSGGAEMFGSMARMAELGFAAPPLGGILLEAPFDFMSDTLRGMRGIMLDIHQRPQQLLEAEQWVLEMELEYALYFSKLTGVKAAGIPLHRGSDGFMSIKQFEKFYWPQLRELMLRLIENGITPSPFYEGVWDQRLDYLADLPKGQTVGMFQSSDIFKVKEKVGDVMCIIGGMKNSMLQGGTVESVRAYTRELCERVGAGGGFIMSTGVGELEGCKPELVRAWIDATREFGVY